MWRLPMSTGISASLAVSMLCLLTVHPSAAVAEGGSQELLRSFGDRLAEAWQRFPAETQKKQRLEMARQAKADFAMGIKTISITQHPTTDAAVLALISNLRSPPPILKSKKAEADRKAFNAACISVFSQEAKGTGDISTTRTPQMCFEWLLRSLVSIKTGLSTPGMPITQAAGVVRVIFSQMLKSSLAPSGVDGMTQYDNNLKKARQSFPVTTEAMKKVNQSLLQLAETAALEVKKWGP